MLRIKSKIVSNSALYLTTNNHHYVSTKSGMFKHAVTTFHNCIVTGINNNS